MRALLAQVAPEGTEATTNARQAAAILERGAGVDLAVFPELFLTGYDPVSASLRALDPDDDAIEIVRDAAARTETALILGFAEKLGSGTANSVCCVDRDGSLKAIYRKIYPFGQLERAAFTPGSKLVVVTLAGRRVAPLICFDMEFPEPARAVSRAGAELLVTVAANMRAYAADHALAARARALDNRRPHLYVNRVGAEAGFDFCGESASISAAGTVRESLGEGHAVVDVDLDLGGPKDLDTDYLRHLRRGLSVDASERIATSTGGRA